MKKKMQQVLQENVEVGHVSNTKRLEQPKNDLEEAMTFHTEGQNELEDVIEKTKLETI